MCISLGQDYTMYCMLRTRLACVFCIVRACMAANVQCRVCGVRPDDGPDDAAFQVAGVPLGPDGAAIQVAGVLDDM